MYGLLNRDIAYIIQAFKEIPEIETAILFGSRAMNNFKPGSDIDLAISGSRLTRDHAIKASGRLNEELPIPYFIDLFLLPDIKNKKLTDHINRIGICIYNRQLKSGNMPEQD